MIGMMIETLRAGVHAYNLDLKRKAAFQAALRTNDPVRKIPERKSDPFELDLADDTPLPVICEMGEDGVCEACQ